MKNNEQQIFCKQMQGSCTWVNKSGFQPFFPDAA